MELYSGSTFDDSGAGVPERADCSGGGVVDSARGLQWLETTGDLAGDNSLVEEWSERVVFESRRPEGVSSLRSSCLAEDSTSVSNDCRKLGPRSGIGMLKSSSLQVASTVGFWVFLEVSLLGSEATSDRSCDRRV